MASADAPRQVAVPPADVQVSGLHHRFGGERTVDVLAGVDLDVPAGAFVSLVGPSGCGKSTLLRILAGLMRPTRGTAAVGGRSAIGRPGMAAYMPQKDNLLPWRRALANATLGAEIAGASRATATAQAVPLFERFGLAGFETSWPSQLSGGMRQRLALLRTFLMDRAVLLLDEPFGALDAITRRQMYAWLQDIWLADRRTVLFVTHDVEEALYLSDRVVVLSPRPGRVTSTIGMDAPRPRSPSLVTDPAFVARKAELLAALET
ncbi:MAG: ABC transporter ATP-binding protein [Actinomycetota bacterium]|nr:ABC transporter ATP-binding protein [Actinomycetota bacterium]